MLERIALYVTLSIVLYSVQVDATTWTFWAIAALFWCAEHLVRKETEVIAMAEGITKYLGMTSEEQEKIKKIYQKTMEQQNK